ncbi:MAG: hypothetical protein LAO24_13525 [Acidobacteriia bacterium]|nr:hypothetical protein [Terriglobia bacterium]
MMTSIWGKVDGAKGNRAAGITEVPVLATNNSTKVKGVGQECPAHTRI